MQNVRRYCYILQGLILNTLSLLLTFLGSLPILQALAPCIQYTPCDVYIQLPSSHWLGSWEHDSVKGKKYMNAIGKALK